MRAWCRKREQLGIHTLLQSWQRAIGSRGEPVYLTLVPPERYTRVVHVLELQLMLVVWSQAKENTIA